MVRLSGDDNRRGVGGSGNMGSPLLLEVNLPFESEILLTFRPYLCFEDQDPYGFNDKVNFYFLRSALVSFQIKKGFQFFVFLF